MITYLYGKNSNSKQMYKSFFSDPLLLVSPRNPLP